MPDYLQRESNKITVANFYEGFGLGKYNFDPPYQRRSLWSEEKKSFLIDSVMRNYPMPPIFLHQKIDDETGKTTYDVIDGKQRLTALLEFIEDKIPVADENGEELGKNPLAGRYFSELSDPAFAEAKSRFWRYVIPIEYIDTGEQQVIDSIFDRLNRNGEPLTGQELRNSTYYGTPLLNLVENAAKLPFWRDRLAVVDRTRMEELEFLSELTFLILEGHELQSSQPELDALYEKYADNAGVVYSEIAANLATVSDYMQSMQLDYDGRKIRGVSHLYGIFAFAHRCVAEGRPVADVIPKLNSFFDLWQAKRYDDVHVKTYKDSMSARTKDRGQRRKRTDSLHAFCR